MPPYSSKPFVNRNMTKTRWRMSKNTPSRLVLAAAIVLYLSIQFYLMQFPIASDDPQFNLYSTPDAYFNNVPVRLRDASRFDNQHETSSFHSSVHCVGETHDPTTAWKHRSCNYVNLCVDLGGDSKQDAKPEIFLVSSESEERFKDSFGKAAVHGQYPYSSTEILGSGSNNYRSDNHSDGAAAGQYSPLDVALGGINPSWRAPPTPRVPYEIGIDKIRWTPKVYNKMPFEKYYELDPNVVLVPYHSFAAANVGHLLWDDFLPIYNLLRIFGYDQSNNPHNRFEQDEINNGYQHLLLRVNTMPVMFGSCDLRARKREECKKNFERFLPLFGVNPDTFSTLTEAKLTKDIVTKEVLSKDSQKAPQSYPICAKHAVAGLGWLTDHGIRNHGWMINHEENSLDVALAHNVGRGPELYSFRNFMLQNIGFETFSVASRSSQHQKVSFRVLLSAHTSKHLDRKFGLEVQQKALAKAFPNAEVSVLDLVGMPLMDQISLVSNQPSIQNKDEERQLRNPGSPMRQRQHTIFISACGGGSATAYFLPKGSSLILYYNEVGGMDYFDNEKNTGGQAMLDWDLMNNLGYLKVHWLPIGSMNEQGGLDALVSLVQHEMNAVLDGLVFG